MSKRRKTAAEYSLIKRSLAMTINEFDDLKRIERCQTVLALMMLDPKDHGDKEQMFLMLLLLQYEWSRIAYEPDDLTMYKSPRRKHIGFDDYNNMEVRRDFRLPGRNEIQRLFHSLRIPHTVTIENGSKFSGEEIFLYSIRRLVFPNTIEQLTKEFGGDTTVWSRAFKWFNIHMTEHFESKIVSAVHTWRGQFRTFREAIKKKFLSIDPARTEFLRGVTMSTIGFIDCTTFATCKVGNGPIQRGQGSQRRSRRVQQSFYSGHKSIDGVKSQFVTFPNGMIGDGTTVVSVRTHDLSVCTISDLDARLAELQDDDECPFTVYGDSAYQVAVLQYILAMMQGGGEVAVIVNDIMNRLRESVEHVNTILKTTFAWTTFNKGLRVMVMDIRGILMTTMILTNCYTCITGNQVSAYFDCRPPSLEEYMV